MYIDIIEMIHREALVVCACVFVYHRDHRRLKKKKHMKKRLYKNSIQTSTAATK